MIKVSQDKYDQLFKDYPDIYGSMTYRVFECFDGWFDILKDLSDDLRRLSFKGTVTQVKEKWGTLCFYVSGATDEQYEAIAKAEKRSASVCEFCGNPGSVVRIGWVRTLCPTCAKHVKEDREARGV